MDSDAESVCRGPNPTISEAGFSEPCVSRRSRRGQCLVRHKFGSAM